MRGLFEALAMIERWLRQVYPSTSRQTRIFWNHILVTAAIIMLKQEDISVTLGNLERYTIIPSASIYRTMKLLENYGILEQIDQELYDFKTAPPKDIMEINLSGESIDIGVLKKELKDTITSVLSTLPLEQGQIKEVARRIDEVEFAPREKTPLENIVGQGFLRPPRGKSKDGET